MYELKNLKLLNKPCCFIQKHELKIKKVVKLLIMDTIVLLIILHHLQDIYSNNMNIEKMKYF